MKKALRIFIPLVLAAVVILFSAWYLLEYDRAFTKDMLLWSARALEEDGNHKLAAWIYNLTYEHSSHEDAIAIELSQQYKDIGNYTKAEFTLSEAIAANCTTELYIALCNLYVEQDKLLDAVALLDSINNPEIKAELDAMRPNSPKLTPNDGFFSKYITVEASVDAGTIYINTKGEYPTTAKDLYTEPIALPAGETVVYALTVSDNGLVSPLAIHGYTIGGIIELVEFSDEAMAAAIRQAIGADDNDAIFTDALWNVKNFTVPAEAKTYKDLVYLPYLESLTINGAVKGELVNLRGLSRLQELQITDATLSDEEMLAVGLLTGLKKLTLSDCGLSSIAALTNMNSLEYLDVSGNALRNLSVIADMQELKTLHLNNNAVTELTELQSLTQLTYLDVSFNSVSTLDPIRSITTLNTLIATQNQISDVQSLTSLRALQELDLSYNSLTDVSAFALCTEISVLNVSNNAITDISTLYTLEKLAHFDFSHNQVEVLPIFNKDVLLVTIDGSHNRIKDLDSLASLSRLNTVLMDYNEELESLEPLDKCPVLIKVNVFGTKVSEVRFLTDKSIIVNYDPTTE